LARGPCNPGTVAGSQTPGTFSVSLVAAGVVDAVGPVDQGDVTIVFKIVRETVTHTVRIESQERVVSKEQGATTPNAHVEFDPVVGISVNVVVAFIGVSPASAISHSFIRLAGPFRVVHAGRNPMLRRGNGQQIYDHGFVPADASSTLGQSAGEVFEPEFGIGDPESGQQVVRSILDLALECRD